MRLQGSGEGDGYGSRSLAEWLPDVVGDLVERYDPLKIILFGSLARGDEGPDSDIDVLVVLPHAPAPARARLLADLREAIRAPVPVDVAVTDPQEIYRRGHLRGWVLYSALHDEGVVVYERAA